MLDCRAISGKQTGNFSGSAWKSSGDAQANAKSHRDAGLSDRGWKSAGQPKKNGLAESDGA